MRNYKIEYSENAVDDIDALMDFIIYEYHSPITAIRYYNGLLKTIASLKRLLH